MKRAIRVVAVIVVPITVVAVLAVLIINRHTSVPGVYIAPPPGKPAHATLVAGHYVGVYEPGVPRSYTPISSFAKVSGVAPDIALYYSSWWKPFPSQFAQEAHTHGVTLFAQMIPFGRGVSFRRLIAGQYDGYLRTFAEQVRRFGHPVIIGFAPEPNGNWYAWGWHHLSPTTWIAAWRHVVSTFRHQGADNVTWLWTVNREAQNAAPVNAWWPGANYVTWVGIDGYFYQRSFRTVFGATLASIRSVTVKPVIISETAVLSALPAAQAIGALIAGILQYRLSGLVWFDAISHQGRTHLDWRLEGRPAALAAFRKGVASMKGAK